MLSHTSKLRVRYGETDQMGYVYYGHYALYYEVGRTDMLRSLGLTYRELETKGIGLPVVSFEIHYSKPARYDDLITIVTKINEKPRNRIIFHYECYDESGNLLLNSGKVTLAFMDLATGKPMRCPEEIDLLFRKHFDEPASA